MFWMRQLYTGAELCVEWECVVCCRAYAVENGAAGGGAAGSRAEECFVREECMRTVRVYEVRLSELWGADVTFVSVYCAGGGGVRDAGWKMWLCGVFAANSRVVGCGVAGSWVQGVGCWLWYCGLSGVAGWQWCGAVWCEV